MKPVKLTDMTTEDLVSLRGALLDLTDHCHPDNAGLVFDKLGSVETVLHCREHNLVLRECTTLQ